MSIINDVSLLTTLSTAFVEKVLSKYEDALLYEIYEQYQDGNEIIDIDIFIGRLLLKIENESVSYKFIPSTHFEKDIKVLLEKEQPSLIKKLEKAIDIRIKNTYKDLF